MLKIPNLELLNKNAKQYFLSKEENKEQYKKAYKSSNQGDVYFEIEMFKQVWENRCLAFDLSEHGEKRVGGQIEAEAYTIIFYEPFTNTYIVFINNKICYEIQNPNEKFLRDLKHHKLCPLSKASRLYNLN